MAKIYDILKMLAEKAPLESKLSFDNVGLLVGDGRREVKCVLTSLDITPWVIEEAINLKAELIVSHHPIIFINPLKCVTPDDSPEVLLLAENKIAAICMHTNLDAADVGVNYELAKACGIREPYTKIGDDGIARAGEIAIPTSMPEYLTQLKKTLNANGLRYYDSGNPVYRVGVCGGSGGDYATRELVEKYELDTIVTSDIKYDTWLNAKKMGLNLIDGDHFCTENLIIPKVAEWIGATFADVSVIVSKSHGQTTEFFV